MKISVIGAGSFGTALALLLHKNGHQVSMWSHSKDTADAIRQNKENSIYLPGFMIPETLLVSGDLQNTLKDAELVLFVVPTQATREVLTNAKQWLRPGAIIISGSKGIEKGTHKLVAEIFLDVLGETFRDKMFFLSGPSFAKEIAAEIPTAVTLAGYNEQAIPPIQKIFSNNYFRAYGTKDVIGVELGGALKNIIAIATGAADGLQLGNNTRAAIITRGLAEIARLGKAMGANPLTLMGLAGMGDLVLTCTGDLSRNRSVGMQLGQGKTLTEIMSTMRMIAEGVPTTESAYELSKMLKVDMPITHAVFSALYEGRSMKEILYQLMTRQLKFEGE